MLSVKTEVPVIFFFRGEESTTTTVNTLAVSEPGIEPYM
jgi:hypothetical protein